MLTDSNRSVIIIGNVNEYKNVLSDCIIKTQMHSDSYFLQRYQTFAVAQVYRRGRIAFGWSKNQGPKVLSCIQLVLVSSNHLKIGREKISSTYRSLLLA